MVSRESGCRSIALLALSITTRGASLWSTTILHFCSAKNELLMIQGLVRASVDTREGQEDSPASLLASHLLRRQGRWTVSTWCIEGRPCGSRGWQFSSSRNTPPARSLVLLMTCACLPFLSSLWRCSMPPPNEHPKEAPPLQRTPNK